MKEYYTTLEQSRRLVGSGISPDTADMHYWESEGKVYTYVGKCEDVNGIPCWSVGALIDLIPFCRVSTPDPICVKYHCWDGSGFETFGETVVDALVEMVCILKERNIL